MRFAATSNLGGDADGVQVLAVLAVLALLVVVVAAITLDDVRFGQGAPLLAADREHASISGSSWVMSLRLAPVEYQR